MKPNDANHGREVLNGHSTWLVLPLLSAV
jgi:hypothetical protein